MIYEAVKGLLLALLKAPSEPPEPPAGSPGSVVVFRAARNYLIYRLIAVAVVAVFAISISGFLTIVLLSTPQTTGVGKVLALLLLPLALGLVLFLYFTTRLEYDMRYYMISDRSLRIRKGVWTIIEVTLTYANVQHLEIKQGPIQQLLGISDLAVRTAGGAGPAVQDRRAAGQQAGHSGDLEGIDNAKEIRDLINGHLKHYRQAGLGDPEERQAGRRGTPPLHPDALLRLQEIRDELRAWRTRITQ